jgi:twinkle protein
MNIKIYHKQTKNTFDITFSGSGTELKSVCPLCSSDRKKHKDKCLNYNTIKETAFCHHCNESFSKYKYFEKKEKTYKKPEWSNTTDLNDRAVKFFESRKINQTVLKKMKITTGKEFMPQFKKDIDTIQFNYFLNDELINIKYRGPEKSFKLHKDSELIFYNLDSIKDTKECVIVEGEIDCLSFIQSGRFDVISVPNGAGKNTEYLDNYLNYFENKEKIYLATDNDIKGLELRNELARRLGYDKCLKVSFKDCKDANEYHLKYGGQNLLKTIEDAIEFPISGLFNFDSIKDSIYELYHKGLEKGYCLGGDYDELISFESGRIYTITGIPNHGKSEWLDFTLAKLSILHDLKFAYFSPENHPLQIHASKIIQQITGRKFNTDSLNPVTLDNAIDYCNDKFFFIRPEDNFNLDNILNIASQGVRKYGINGIIIDPYNKLEHNRKSNITETEYVSKFYDILINFAVKYDLIVFLVAHPVKMQKRADGLHEIPNLYSITGSANFYNKTDFGITVYRNFLTEQIEIYVQKAKFKHLGSIGSLKQVYNINNGRFTDILPDGVEWDNSNWLLRKQKPDQDEFNFDDVQDIDF